MKQAVPLLVQGPNGKITQIDPQSLSQMPLAQYYQMASSFVNAQSALYYDTAVIVAGTAITAGMKQALFTKGKAEDSVTFNTAGAIAEKGEYLTNMINNGEFEGGTTFILEQICVGLDLTSELPTTVGSRGQTVAPNYTASVVISAANNHKAYRDQLELQYIRNEEVKLRAPLRYWQSPFGVSGAFGSSNSGFIQNGYNANGFTLLTRPVVLQSEDRFQFNIQALVETFTPTIGANVRVELIGKAIKTFIP